MVNARRAAAQYNLGHTGAQDDLGVLLADLLDLADLDGVSSRDLSRAHVCLHWPRFALKMARNDVHFIAAGDKLLRPSTHSNLCFVYLRTRAGQAPKGGPSSRNRPRLDR